MCTVTVCVRVHVYVCTLGRTGVRLMVEFQETERDREISLDLKPRQEARRLSHSLKKWVSQNSGNRYYVLLGVCVCTPASLHVAGLIEFFPDTH